MSLFCNATVTLAMSSCMTCIRSNGVYIPLHGQTNNFAPVVVPGDLLPSAVGSFADDILVTIPSGCGSWVLTGNCTVTATINGADIGSGDNIQVVFELYRGTQSAGTPLTTTTAVQPFVGDTQSTQTLQANLAYTVPAGNYSLYAEITITHADGSINVLNTNSFISYEAVPVHFLQ